MALGCSTQDPEASGLPYYNTPDFTPIFIAEKIDPTTLISHTIADFSFIDQDSQAFNQTNIEGKIHVANFIFTTCGSICPSMIRNMSILSDSLQNDPSMALVSYSVTPWIDQPAILKKYKSERGIQNKNWHFITGNKSDIYSLARTSYFAEEDLGFTKDSTEFLHTEHFILVDKKKRIRGIYNGTLKLEMHSILEDIRTLQREDN